MITKGKNLKLPPADKDIGGTINFGPLRSQTNRSDSSLSGVVISGSEAIDCLEKALKEGVFVDLTDPLNDKTD
jgi:hypothetical protein